MEMFQTSQQYYNPGLIYYQKSCVVMIESCSSAEKMLPVRRTTSSKCVIHFRTREFLKNKNNPYRRLHSHWKLFSQWLFLSFFRSVAHFEMFSFSAVKNRDEKCNLCFLFPPFYEIGFSFRIWFETLQFWDGERMRVMKLVKDMVPLLFSLSWVKWNNNTSTCVKKWKDLFFIFIFFLGGGFHARTLFWFK